ncbi:MAG: hypothetical protein H6822_14495 [Planctomycetaceae bacterium]|nr:hypothetical protein [Planctomycetales bacterium]MCB9923389.1 hypothetical protein [Planctomycetaceae bacterium]
MSAIAVILLVTFLWFWPQRKRNPLIQRLYDRHRHALARFGLHHTAWTMFKAGTNRNHFLKLRLHSIPSAPAGLPTGVELIQVNTLELHAEEQLGELDSSTREEHRTVELRDPWKRGGIWGELMDERLRRIVLAVIRSDTGPNTRHQLACGLVRWCLLHRVRLPFKEFEGTAVYGQQEFTAPWTNGGRTTDPRGREIVKYTLKLRRGPDGRLVFDT